MATLGEKLLANQINAETARTTAENRKRDQDRRLWDANNLKVIAVIEEVKAIIVNAIENDEPLKAVKLPTAAPFNTYQWPNKSFSGIEEATKELGNHSHFTALLSFFTWADENGLVGKFDYDWDGGGQSSWYNAVVTPKVAR